MESQFRCGKCGKPISSKFAKCLDCGSLGPHIFSGSGSAVEGGPPVAQPPHRRDSYPADMIDRPQPAPSRPERYSSPEPQEAPTEPVRSLPSRDFDDDSKFPAGMRSRSPILDFVEGIDASREREPRRRPERESSRDSAGQSDSYGSSDEDEGEQNSIPSAGSSSTITYIISAILIISLIIAALYVYSNFDSLTRWLASPTVPEVFKPSN
jgi:hypothetical protein